jgi:hypothetical protein
MEKPSLQSKSTHLKSKFFPAKIPFSKIQKKKKQWIAKIICVNQKKTKNQGRSDRLSRLSNA